MPASQPRKPGRPRALDDTRRRELCALVSAGCSLAAAAKYIGCAACTVCREAARDPEFSAMLRRALLHAKRIPSKIVRDFANKYVQVAARLSQQADDLNGDKPTVRLLTPEQLARFVELTIDSAQEEATMAGADTSTHNLASCIKPDSSTDSRPDPSTPSAQNPAVSHPPAAIRAAMGNTPPRLTLLPVPTCNPLWQFRIMIKLLREVRRGAQNCKTGRLNSPRPPRQCKIPSLARQVHCHA